jgi:hypothetical protein
MAVWACHRRGALPGICHVVLVAAGCGPARTGLGSVVGGYCGEEGGHDGSGGAGGGQERLGWAGSGVPGGDACGEGRVQGSGQGQQQGQDLCRVSSRILRCQVSGPAGSMEPMVAVQAGVLEPNGDGRLRANFATTCRARPTCSSSSRSAHTASVSAMTCSAADLIAAGICKSPDPSRERTTS